MEEKIENPRTDFLAIGEASREETAEGRTGLFPHPTSGLVPGVRRAALTRCWHHVPDRASVPRPHPRPAVDREAPAAADRVGAGEAERDPSPGDRSGEPLLAEPTFPHGRAGARSRGGPQGGRLRGAQGGAGRQVPRAPSAGGPAGPPQRHQEVVLTVSPAGPRPRKLHCPQWGLVRPGLLPRLPEGRCGHGLRHRRHKRRLYEAVIKLPTVLFGRQCEILVGA